MTPTPRYPCLNDIISVLFHKSFQTNEYLLVHLNELYSLPCSKVLDNNWDKTAEFIIDCVFGAIRKSKEIFKINKVWVPNFSRRHVYHVLFSVQISENDVLKDESNLKWFNVPDIKTIQVQGKLYSPEIMAFIMMKEVSYGSYEGLSENNSEVQRNINLLSEVSECDVIITKTDSIPEEYLELLKSSDIQICDQRCLYVDFLLTCFPYLYMNVKLFNHIVADIMCWEKDDCISLFRAADLYNRGALSFHDYILIFAACSKTTSHTGFAAEIRSKYIFRFFDENGDGLMDYDNYLKLIKCIRIAKKQSADSVSIDVDAKKYATSMGISPDIAITLVNFVAAVGELKIRGTSVILRFSKSIKEYLQDTGLIQTRNVNKHKSYDSEENYDTGSHIINDDDLTLPKVDQFDISTHTLRIKNYGAFIDIDETWTQNWVSPVSSQLMKSAKVQTSVERFNQFSAANEIINFLKYFSQPDPSEGKLKLSWGTFDVKKFGTCLMILANDLIEIMENEHRLVEIKSPVYVVGDLHGNFDNLMYLEELLWPLSPTLSPCNLLFLGDYVDRGEYGLEVVAYLFAYKLHNPNAFFMLRGNHEVRDIQKAFTFYKECLDKLGPQLGSEVWASLNNVFDVMPLAAVVDGRIFCCHGGIPPPAICPTLSSINEIPSKVIHPTTTLHLFDQIFTNFSVHLPIPKTQSQLAWCLMWDDPVRMNEASAETKLELEVQDGFAHNSRRGTASVFSANALDQFLEKHKLSHVIRAHEYQYTGASIQFNGRLLTVFSSSDYCGGRNDSACILLARKKICIFRIEPKGYIN